MSKMAAIAVSSIAHLRALRALLEVVALQSRLQRKVDVMLTSYG
jgi:hypothetical protein